MANPISVPPQATPSPQPAQARTSGALVLNINAPLSNYAGDTPVNEPSSGINPTAPAIGAGPSADTFQRRNNSPFAPNPAAAPKEQLEQSYFNALNARNDAEQARNGYLNLANQLNGQAFQTNQTPQQPALVAPPAQPDVNAAQFQQQLNQLQQMQQAKLQQQQQLFDQQMKQQQASLQAQTAQLQQQLQAQQQQNSQLLQQQQQLMQQAQPQALPQQANPYAQMDPMMQQQLQQQQMMQQMQQQNPYGQMDPMQQQMMQQNPYAQMDPTQQQRLMQDPYAQAQQAGMDPMAQQMQQPMDPNMMQQPMGNNLQMMRPEELNVLVQGPDQNQKLNAILEFAARQQGNAETYELLKREAMTPTNQLPPGQAQEDGNLIRQAALFALGNLNRAQNSQVETNMLPGLDVINNILKSPQESPAVKAAAVTSLGYIDRPNDKLISGMLNRASKDPSQDVKNAVQQVKSGMMSAASQAQAAAAAAQQGQMPQGGMPQYS